MHLVITNAHNGDPYPIDTLFMYMANMAWNSAMNVGGTTQMLTAKDPGGDYRIPRIIYSDAYFSEMVAYADLVLPDTTYLERWDCISLLDRPICSADGPADAIRQPVVAPDRDVRPFQDVLLDLGHRLGLPGMTNEDGSARFPKGYADYLVHHERQPGVGSLMGWRGADGSQEGKGPPNPEQLERYIENGCFWQGEIPPEARYFKHANRAYLDYAGTDGLHRDAPSRSRSSSTARCCRSSASRRRAWARCSRPSASARGSGPISTRCRSGTRRSRIAAGDEQGFPLHAITQRPMAMYHSWGAMNAWLRQIHGSNRLYLNRARAAALGLEDDGWVWITSRHGRVKAQIRLMEGVNPDTCWTWNAIGKRRRRLEPDAATAPEATEGLSAQPSDRRASARARRRLSLRQRRPGDRAGGLVRPAGPARAGGRRRGRRQRAAVRSCCAPPPGLRRRAAGVALRRRVPRAPEATGMTSLPRDAARPGASAW